MEGLRLRVVPKIPVQRPRPAVRISASRRVEAPSRHRHESSPGEEVVFRWRECPNTQVDDELEGPRRVHRRVVADAGSDVL